MNDILSGIFNWIKNDYNTYPFRFAVELFAWAISISCSITMAVTVPNPPLIVLYPVWITGCIMYAWAAYTRRSFGILANCLFLIAIDSVGLIRMVWYL